VRERLKAWYVYPAHIAEANPRKLRRHTEVFDYSAIELNWLRNAWNILTLYWSFEYIIHGKRFRAEYKPLLRRMTHDYGRQPKSLIPYR
jgi:hypothetical protein